MLKIRRLAFIGIALMLAGAIGAMAGTSLACGAGKLTGEESFCGLTYFWILGIPISSVVALAIGVPLYGVFHLLGLDRWWHYSAAGAVIAAAILCASYVSGATWPFSSWIAVLQTVSIPVTATLTLWFLLSDLRQARNDAASQASRTE